MALTKKTTEDYLTKNFINIGQEEEGEQKHEMTIVASFSKPPDTGYWQADIEHGWGIKATAAHCDDCKEIVPEIRNMVLKISNQMNQMENEEENIPIKKNPQDDENDHHWIHVSFKHEKLHDDLSVNHHEFSVGSWMVNKLRHGNKENCQCIACKRIKTKMINAQIELMNQDEERAMFPKPLILVDGKHSSVCECQKCHTAARDRRDMCLTCPLPKILPNGQHSVVCKCKTCDDKRILILERREALVKREDMIQKAWFVGICIAGSLLLMALFGILSAAYNYNAGGESSNCTKDVYLANTFEEVPSLPFMIYFDKEESEFIIPLTNETKACCCTLTSHKYCTIENKMAA